MNKHDYSTLFMPTYKRTGQPMIRGTGMYLYDAAGRKYLDFGSGIAVNSLGHANPLLIKTLQEQGERLIHSSNLYYSKPQIELAKFLIDHSFGTRVFFCNSGTEANEAAIKFARKWAHKISSDKYHVLSFTDGFHGRTYGALAATAQEKFHAGFEPMPEGFHYAPFNNLAVTEKLLKQFSYAAIIIEPLQGEGGVNPVSQEFLKFLREYATANSIALIFDEIQCGVGRTGRLWNYEQYGIEPDMMTIAKPIGGGLPLGVVVCKEMFVDSIAPGDHGTTFGGNPLACALGLQVLKTVSKEPFLKKVRENGDYLQQKLRSLQNQYASIEDIRGSGLLVGVRMKDDPIEIVDACREHGLLVVKANHNTIRFIPPLIVTREDIDKAIAIFITALDKAGKK